MTIEDPITECSWLPFVVPNNQSVRGDSREFDVSGIF